MRLYLLPLLLAGLLSFSLHTYAEGPQRPELKLERTEVGVGERELSGIAVTKDGTYVVSDNDDDHYIFKIVPVKSETKTPRFALEPVIDLKQLAGFDAYKKALRDDKMLDDQSKKLDLEGIAVCDGTIYLINERARDVLEIKDKKTLRKLPVDWSPVAKSLHEGGSNAGFEGITADCAHKVLYVAKEREPRILMQVELDHYKVTTELDLAKSDRQGQKIINPFTGQGLLDIPPDFTDLALDGGYLYALERGTYEIAKVDLTSMKVVARASYLKSEHLLFDTGEPFGNAEALALTPKHVIVGFDNNGAPLSAVAAQNLGVSGAHEVLMYFERPAGF